jgi:lipid-A-disaccharide synthase
MTNLFVVAAERSGDDIGAALIKDIQSLDPDCQIEGIGGTAMADCGVPSQMDIEGLSILGFVEGLKHYPMIMRKVKTSADLILKSQAKAVVLIDSWGFMIRLAKRLKMLGYKGKIIKYVAPQVWAMREGRVKILAEVTDILLSIQPMDARYFEKHGLKTIYVGNPVFDEDYNSGNALSLRKKYGLGELPILSVWFGSRPSEVERLTEPFCVTIALLKKQFPDLVVMSPVAETVRELLRNHLSASLVDDEVLLLEEAEKLDVMAASDVALACSGTVTTQLASAGVPTIVAYRLNGLTYFVAKQLFKPNYISIVNIAANKPLMPEFLQSDANGPNLAAAVTQFLKDNNLSDVASKALTAQTQLMGAGHPEKVSKKAARAVLTALKV